MSKLPQQKQVMRAYHRKEREELREFLDRLPAGRLLGPESGDQKLIFADDPKWLEKESVQIVCENGYVELENWR